MLLRRPMFALIRQPRTANHRFRPALQRLEFRRVLSAEEFATHVSEYGEFGSEGFGDFGDFFDYGATPDSGGFSDYGATWQGNGCGPEGPLNDFVPNAPFGFDYTEACNAHDVCYASGEAKTACDTQFLADMYAVCDGNAFCEAIANVYYYAVSWFGDAYYGASTSDTSYVIDMSSYGGN